MINVLKKIFLFKYNKPYYLIQLIHLPQLKMILSYKLSKQLRKCMNLKMGQDQLHILILERILSIKLSQDKYILS